MDGALDGGWGSCQSADALCLELCCGVVGVVVGVGGGGQL